MPNGTATFYGSVYRAIFRAARPRIRPPRMTPSNNPDLADFVRAERSPATRTQLAAACLISLFIIRYCVNRHSAGV